MKNDRWTAGDVARLALKQKGGSQSVRRPKGVRLPKPLSAEIILMKIFLGNEKIHFIAELVFHPSRKWRFDIAIPERKIAIEYEGIFSAKSRHTSVKGFTGDCDKYNAAQLLGWIVLRYTAKNYKNFFNDIKTLIDGKDKIRN